MIEDRPSSTHPPLPPTTEDDRISRLRLLRSRRVGISTYDRLMAEHGSAAQALDALPEVAAQAGVSKYAPCSLDRAQAEYEEGHRFGATLVFREDALYPALLADLKDSPPFFWAKGRLELLGRRSLSLIGARNASSLGARMARTLAEELGQEGYVITSGLARGIDTASHLAALPTGTIAVFAGGLDRPYPAENTELAERIASDGVVMSEAPMGLAPMARHFPSRNRIVSGLSAAVIVVEAAARSGSLITARAALDQGREVLAVPGHPFDARSGGCNMLIRDGATLVRGVADIREALAPLAPEDPVQEELPLDAEKSTLRDTAALHRKILDRLGPSPIAEDQLVRDLHSPAAAVMPVLTDLELDGRIERQPGGLLSLSAASGGVSKGG